MWMAPPVRPPHPFLYLPEYEKNSLGPRARSSLSFSHSAPSRVETDGDKIGQTKPKNPDMNAWA